MDDWGAAQWVLVALLVVTLMINFAGFLLQKKPFSERLGWMLAELTNSAALVALLIWGGFF